MAGMLSPGQFGPYEPAYGHLYAPDDAAKDKKQALSAVTKSHPYRGDLKGLAVSKAMFN